MRERSRCVPGRGSGSGRRLGEGCRLRKKPRFLQGSFSCYGASQEKVAARMKVYCCQLDIAWENKPENYGRVSDWVRKSRPEPGSLFVLPEMFSTGFSMNVAGIAEEASPGTMEFLREIARESGVYFMAGLVTRGPDGRGLNQSVVISPAGTKISRPQGCCHVDR